MKFMQYANRVHGWLYYLPRTYKKLLMLVVDATMLPFALLVAYALRMGMYPLAAAQTLPSQFYWLAPLVTLPTLYSFGVYRSMVRYQGIHSAASGALAMLVAAMALAGLSFMFSLDMPRSVFIIYWMFGAIYLASSRFAARVYLVWGMHRQNKREPVVIFGAGSAGYQLASSLQESMEYAPVAFVDDKVSLQGTMINNLPVLSRKGLLTFINRHPVAEVLLAIPRASRTQRMDAVKFLNQLPDVEVKSIPSLVDIVNGRARIEEVRHIDIEDLLGRDSVPPKEELLRACITGKSVVVTGAGGSIGSELCRQIVALAPQRLVLYEQNEFGLYKLDQELRAVVQQKGLSVEIITVLGSVLNEGLMEQICKQYAVNTFYHAAAYKHVPIVESNAAAGVRNNILGTFYAAQAAEKAGVERFILISTDKAVRPTNVMGATKRFAELVLQAMADRGSETIFSMVRFGNVLGSSGSVVPLFHEQIKQGGPVTVTHAEVTRYFMTIPEAALLVIQAGSMAKGGEVFLLDMGEPVRIYDLARTMIRLMGLKVCDAQNPDGDIEIKVTGLRPGEKLYEELLISDARCETQHSMIMQASEEFLQWQDFLLAFEQVKVALEASDDQALRALLLKYVEGYQPTSRDVA